jgi:pseudouridylate synthase
MKTQPSPSLPRVALESTVITHGLPYPQNLALARDMERLVIENGAQPATIAILDGQVRIGLTDAELERLASLSPVCKISRRDFTAAMLRRESGGTTVAGTLFAAHRAGIRLFATGGIGGVHDVACLDISADLQALSDTPLVVVCAGAKAILDLPATLEYLETMSVPVIGYGTDEFPAFYSRSSGLSVSLRLDSPEEVVRYAHLHWQLGLSSAVLVCQPIPVEDEIPAEHINAAIGQARRQAQEQDIHGQVLTPFLLSRLVELTSGASLQANLSLLKNNAVLAARIACSLAATENQKPV